MVKFKFPGKPSKMMSRSLVSAYSVAVATCDTSSISEDLCFGLSLFQSTFGDDHEREPFNGFTNEDIDEAKFKKRTHEMYLKEKMILQGLDVSATSSKKVPKVDNKIIETQSSGKSNTTISQKTLNECLPRPKERKKTSKLWRHKRMMNRYHPKIQIRHNFKSLNKNSLMRFKHKTLSANYLSDRYCRKFILPSRSLHSSRVIKPNKRFIDHERNYKLKVTKEAETNLLEDEYDLYDVRSDDSDTSCCEFLKKRPKVDPPSSKCIIREARLNITTETTITGPFSAKKIADKESRSGVITCGICGSVRFYKYILQTRKFGIYSCEPCRRFILKMIKYSKQPHFELLKCKAESGVGKCVILPLSPSRRKEPEDPLKNFRCNACLLSLCLRKYIMPASIKKSLIQLIPEEVKSNHLNGLSPPDLKKPLPMLDHPLSGVCKPAPSEEGYDKQRKRLNMHNYLRNVRSSKRATDKYDARSIKSSFIHKRNNSHQRITTRNKLPRGSTRNEDSYAEKDHYIPRGPRIKHVCRSASSVLKTSSNDKEIEDHPCPISDTDCGKNSRKNSETKPTEKPHLVKMRQCDDSIPTISEHTSDTDANTQYGARTLQDFGKDSSDESDGNEDKLISTDFWEAYDPDEVFKTGFPLISSELLNVRALCFLCGSAGIEKLLYCVSCCEPYHWYCAEGPSAFRDESELEKCRVNWVCRKCKVCSACEERDSRILISCQRCKNSYHDECLTNKALNKKLFKSDRPWVCPNCLKCKSCNDTSVFTYVGNIPLCSECFKLRQKGSFCPLCQRCYQDDDYNVKMMECGTCEKWIHAKCEGISHEKYQILSFLPDTIEFVCRLCCSVPPAQWWLAVEDELKAGYLGILKCLCKNKKISDLFKESPRKSICRCNTTPNKLLKKARLFSISEADLVSADSAMDADSFSPASEILKPSTASNGDSTSGASVLSNDKYDDSDTNESNNTDCENRDVVDSAPEGSQSSIESQQQKCSHCCYNSETRTKINNDLLAIKAKVHNNQYSSLLSFHQELISVIDQVEELDLIQTYRESLKKFFPWFDPDCPEFNEDDIDDAVTAVASSSCCTSENGPSSIRIDSTTTECSAAAGAEEEEFDNLRKLISADEYDYENFKMLDLRKCNLCKGTGEAIPSEGGRLIYCGRNEWVHSNCALWSSEVFEEIDGSLQNIHSAISRGRQIRCTICDKKGASVGCCYKNCTLTYHFLCAKKANCVFLQNRTIYCQNHDTNEITLPFLSSEKDFEILRPVYIETDRKKKKLECHSNVKLRIGSLHVENLGKIDPHLSDNPKYILPIYYRCTRLFWSTTKPWKIVQYHIQIKLRYCYQPNGCDSEVNYTVDHSQSMASSSRGSSDNDQEVIKHLVSEMVNKIACGKEDYSAMFMGSQPGGGDILSPELQEAIYKDLPNDLLNDKTLHDIWTNYEDSMGDNEPAVGHSNDKNITASSTQPSLTLITGKKPPHIARALANAAHRDDRKNSKKTKTAESYGNLAGARNHRRSSDDARSSSKNNKYLRDKNICEANVGAVKKSGLNQGNGETTLGSTLFYNELCNKVKRKIDHENSSMMVSASTGLTNTKKKHYDATPIDFYHEAAERTFKPTYVQSYEKILQLDGMVDISDEEPVKCIRCHRTYRTSLSFERHLDVCNSDDFNDYMISSCESDTSSEEDKIAAAEGPTMMANLYDMGQQQKYMFAIEDHQNPATVQYVTAASNVCNMAANTMYSFAGDIQQNHIQSQQQQLSIAPQAAYVQKQECLTMTSQQPHIMQDTSIKQEIFATATLNGIPGTVTQQPVSNAQSYQMAQPTYVLQSFPKQEVIPTYVTVDNSIADCIRAQETLIQPQPQLQLHQVATTIASQPSMNFQPTIPTILGTVMQPSVIETPTYIINTAPTPNPAELFAPQNNIILPNQPATMLFGMETLVSNTVMSSSQFMTSESHLAGNIGSSTMYQTTTTQVFQASKQMPPPQPIPTSGFIVINSPIQQMPVQQPTPIQTAKPIQIQATPASTNMPEKYMYVQVNAQNMANFKAAEKPKPIITKAIKNNVAPRDKPAKVMKVRNNKPAYISQIKLPSPSATQPVPAPQIYQNEKPPNTMLKNGYVRSTINGLNCQIDPKSLAKPNHLQSITRPVTNGAISPRKYPQQPVPVAQVVPRQNPMLAQKKTSNLTGLSVATSTNTAAKPQKLPSPKVDKCVNTDNNGLIKQPPTAAVGVSTASANTMPEAANERTIQISYTIDDKAHQQMLNLNGGTAPTATKSWQLNIAVEESTVIQKVEPEAKIIVAPKIEPEPKIVPQVIPEPIKPPSPQTKVSRQSMPELELFSNTPPKTTTQLNHTMPKIEIKSESEKLFDELLRQHKLSLETTPTANVAAPQSNEISLQTESETFEIRIPKLKPVAKVTTATRIKYKPQLVNDTSKTSPSSSSLPSEGATSSLKLNHSKKKVILEKENFDKLQSIVNESSSDNAKNWKTASISFEVNAEDGFTYKTNNLMDLWNKIIESVQKSRAQCKLPLLPKNAMLNADSVYGLLGFENNASKYLLEQLPDAWKCIFYKPVFHKSQMQNCKSSPMKNESGCARTEPFNSSHKYDMFGWLASRHRKPPKFMMISDADIVNGNRRVTSLNLPMAMRFRHLKETAKETVGVFRSDIHGRGLFCLRDIDPGEMVIEYAGEVIRSTLTDKREKYYTSKGIGCYMFRIDDKYVVDATMCGNAARFINHSCEPNCYSRIVDILGKKHILIFALRKIPKGEELTYDYKFPLEDDKISCHCLSRKCRKYLN